MRIGNFFNFTNPWLTISYALQGVTRTQNAAWDGILTGDPSFNPYTNRDWMSRYIFLARDGYQRESSTVMITEENKKAEGHTANLAMAA